MVFFILSINKLYTLLTWWIHYRTKCSVSSYFVLCKMSWRANDNIGILDTHLWLWRIIPNHLQFKPSLLSGGANHKKVGLKKEELKLILPDSGWTEVLNQVQDKKRFILNCDSSKDTLVESKSTNMEFKFSIVSSNPFSFSCLCMCKFVCIITRVTSYSD